MSRTALFVRNSAHGLYAVEDMSRSTGRRVFVNATTGTNAGGAGDSPDNPVASLTYALTLCTAGAGDIIYLMPGHAETIGVTGAAAMTLNVAGVKIIGLGGRTTRPAFLIDGFADTYVSITGADTYIENVTFKAGHADIAVAVAVGADGVEFHNCSWEENTTNEDFVICIDDGGANVSDRMVVEDCEFIQPATSGTHAISFGAAQDRCIIRNNVFLGFWETTAIGGAGVVTNIIVEGNLIQNRDTDADQCILFPDNSTGIVSDNRVHGAVAGNATTNISCGTKMGLFENYSVDAAGDVQGVLDPVAT